MPRRYVGRFLAVALTSLLFVGWAVGAPFLGWLSDRIGRRKPPILAGLALESRPGGARLSSGPAHARLAALRVLIGFFGSAQIVCYAALATRI